MQDDGHSVFADLLKNSEDNLFSLLSLFKNTLVFIFDTDGRFTFGHTDSRSRLHSDPSHFMGKKVSSIMPEHVVTPFNRAFEQNRQGEVAEFDYWMDLITHKGWFSATCTPIFRNGKFHGSMAIVRDVTAEKTASEALKNSERNYRTLVEMATMGIVIISEGKVVYANPPASEISGFSNTEIIGHSFLDFISPSERERVSTIHESRMAGKSVPETYEVKMLRKSGRLINVEVSARAINYQGKSSVQVLMQDISSRKKAEKELITIQQTLQEKVNERTKELEKYRYHLEELVEKRTGRLKDTISLLRTEVEERMLAEEKVEHLNLILRAIRDINQLITNETDTQKLIQGACRRLVKTRGYKDAWIFLKKRDGSFRSASDTQSGEGMSSLMKHIEEGNLTACLEKSLTTVGTWVSTEDRDVCDSCPFFPDTGEQGRIMACRLECRSRVYGVLTVTCLGESPPDAEEISLFSEVCDDIGFALDSIEQEKARKKAASALAESRNRYEALFENATMGIMFLDEDRILETNARCAEVFGTSSDDLIGKTPWELSPETQPDGTRSKEAATGYIRRAMEKGPQHFRWIHRRYSGEDFPAEVSLNAIVINGRKYIQAILKDITIRENAEKALIKSEKNYRTLYGNVPVGLFRCDMTEGGRFLEVNPAMVSMFRYASEKDLVNAGTVERFFSDGSLGKMLKKLGSKKVLQDFTAKMLRADGSTFWASISARPFSWETGNSSLIDGIIKDISETKTYETTLKQSVEKLRSAIEGTVSAMSILVEMKDPYTSGHQKGVAHLASAIAGEMGLPAETADCVRIAATLHDLGKLSIPTEILSKPGVLSEYEIAYLKTHPQAAYDILKSIDFPWPIARAILQHHERMDGSGYPAGLRGREIMVEARIIAVSDVVEATASRRPYRASKGIDVALEAIEQGSGTIYDPRVVDACVRLFRKKDFKLLDHDSLLIDSDFSF